MRTSKSLTLSQAIEGMLFYKRAAGKSPNTIESYRFLLDKLKLYFRDDPPFASITRDQLVRFFAWPKKDLTPYWIDPADLEPERITYCALIEV